MFGICFVSAFAATHLSPSAALNFKPVSPRLYPSKLFLAPGIMVSSIFCPELAPTCACLALDAEHGNLCVFLTHPGLSLSITRLIISTPFCLLLPSLCNIPVVNSCRSHLECRDLLSQKV